MPDLRDHASATLEDVAAVFTSRGNVAHDDGTPEETVEAAVTPNLLHMLGARVVLGRDFMESDGQPEPPRYRRQRRSAADRPTAFFPTSRSPES